MNPLRPLATAALLLAGLAAYAQMARTAQVTRTDLLRADLDAPGREIVQARVWFAPGAAFGRHEHPGDEIAYVLEGTLEYALDGRPPVTLRAGEVLFIAAGTPHAARNVGSTHAVELATYVHPKGEALLARVE